MGTFLGVLAILSASAAAGMRVALPLLIIGLLRGQLWYQVLLLEKINPQVIVAILTSWSLFELFASKRLMGQRILQIVQLVFTPVVGVMLSVTVARLLQLALMPIWLVALIGGLFSLALRLVITGWFFRLRGIPLWVTLFEDFLCVGLVLFAFSAPEYGGLIAMLLLWIIIRSSTAWRRWFQEKKGRSNQLSPHPETLD